MDYGESYQKKSAHKAFGEGGNKKKKKKKKQNSNYSAKRIAGKSSGY